VFGVLAVGQVVGALDIVGGLISAVSWIMLTVAQICIALTIFFLRFFITLASYNNYIDVSVVKLGWAMVRDVANMFFVVALLIIAFATILGLEQYEWKKGLVKLVIMAIFINFSNLIAQLIIDAAHVFTITFLNAISATAGGNLINMFKLDTIVTMVSGKDLGVTPESAQTAILGASVVATLFAILSAVALGSYVIVMAIRVVVLWALIILSPLAYVLYAVPKGEKYAQQWWSEFTKHVVVAPVMVFFLWLAFATLGSGQILNEIVGPGVVPLQVGEEVQSVSLSNVSSWENMANYLIALVFLMIGLKMTQESGAQGAGLVGGAVNFGKKVATIATGYAAGRWLVGGAAKVAGGVAKGALWYAPAIGGEKWATRGKIIGNAVKGWYRGKGYETTDEGEHIRQEIEEKRELLDNANSPERRAAIAKQIEQLKKEETSIGEKKADGSEGAYKSEAEKKAALESKQAEIQRNEKMLEQSQGMTETQRAGLKEEIEGLEKEMPKHMGGGMFGYFARKDIQLQKQLAKTEKQQDFRKQILWKRVGSEAGGNVMGLSIGMGGRGLGFGKTGKYRIFGDKYKQEVREWAKDAEGKDIVGQQAVYLEGSKKGQKKWKQKYAGSDAQDRVERGWFQAEEERSKSKDSEYETLGKLEVLKKSRLKYDVESGKFAYETAKGTMDQRIASHTIAGEVHHAAIEKLEAEGRLNLMLGKVSLKAFTVKGVNDLFEKQSMAKVYKDALASVEDTKLNDKLSEKMKYGTGLDKIASLVESGMFGTPEEIGAIEKAQKELDAIKKEREVARKDVVETNTSLAALVKKEQDGAEVSEDDKKDLVSARATLEDIEEEENRGDLTDERRKELDELKAYAQEEIASIEARQDMAGSLTSEEAIEKAKLEREKTEKEEKMIALLKKETEVKNRLKTARGVFGQHAERLRDGDETILDQYQQQLGVLASGEDAKAAALEQEAATERDAEKKADKQREAQGHRAKAADYRTTHGIFEKQRSTLGQGGVAWQYGLAKAKQAEQKRSHDYEHNLLLSDSEQRSIWDKRGINTPTNAMREMIEQMEKDFSQMSYETFVESSGKMFIEMAEKSAKGTITNADRAALAGFFKRGFNESWVDDVIIGVMTNEESRAAIGSQLGWRDAGFSPDKIRDLEMFIASGGNTKFAKNNVVISEIVDEAMNGDKEYRMSVAQVYEGLNTGVFKKEDGTSFSPEAIQKLKAATRKRLTEENRVLTTYQQDLFDKFLATEAKQIEGSAQQRGEVMKHYLDTLEESQGSMEWFGNLRNEAIRNGHGENAGWALSHDVGGGKSMYIASGVRMARDHVYFDLNKTDQYMRSKAHPHSDVNLAIGGEGEDYGQISTEIRDYDYKTMRGDIVDANGHRGTTARTIQFHMGLSSADKTADQKDSNGFFAVGKAKSTRAVWRKNQALAFKLAKEKRLKLSNGVTVNEADENKREEALAAMMVMKNIMVPQMRANMNDFLMTAAVASGMSAYDGVKGNMRLSLPYFEKDGSVHYKSFSRAQDFIGAVRSGMFGEHFGGIPNFKPSDSGRPDQDHTPS